MEETRGIAAAPAEDRAPATPAPPRLSGYEAVLVGADLAAFVGATALAFFLYFGTNVPKEILVGYVSFLPLLLGWRLFCAYALGLYDLRHRLTALDHAFAGTGAAIASVLFGYLALALVQLYGFDEVRVSRVAVSIEAVILAVWFGLSRWAVLAWLEKRGWRQRAALAGPAAACTALAAEMAEHGPRLFSVAATIDLNADGTFSAAGLGDLIDRQHIDQVILAGVDLSQMELRDLLRHCDRRGTDVYVYPELGATLLVARAVTSVAGVPLIPLRPAYASRVYRIGKRLFDWTAAAALLLLTAPLWVVAALAVKASSSGPAFYSQERVGRYGSSFRVYKLRTMRQDAEAQTGAVLSQANDPRITPLGRWLRRLRIDEIPQLWNVLRGEMSLVGPRPERPEFTDQFRDENPLYERRFLVRPGLTGLAQIHGRYDTDYTHKLRYDLIYISNISLVSDLRILAATVQTVLTGKGAA